MQISTHAHTHINTMTRPGLRAGLSENGGEGFEKWWGKS